LDLASNVKLQVLEPKTLKLAPKLVLELALKLAPKLVLELAPKLAPKLVLELVLELALGLAILQPKMQQSLEP